MPENPYRVHMVYVTPQGDYFSVVNTDHDGYVTIEYEDGATTAVSYEFMEDCDFYSL